MELTVGANCIKITETNEEDIVILVVSHSILHALQWLQEHKTRYLNQKAAVQITYISLTIEPDMELPFLVHYRNRLSDNQEHIWLQSLTNVPDCYLDFQRFRYAGQSSF